MANHRLAIDKAAIDRAITTTRLTSYMYASGGDPDRARALYLWDREVALALIRDIAILEVALRNSINRELVVLHGQDWHKKEIGLDARSRNALSIAWSRLGQGKKTSGHLIAQLMFGFWRDLIEPGGYFGRDPMKFKADYEDLWRRGLHRAFPGGRNEAASEGGKFTRSWTLETIAVVHATRNRTAHHEPLVNGIPLPGQGQRVGSRLSVRQAHDECMKLARLIDRDLASWVAATTTVPVALKARP
jgi:hypothetical protein